ncbi:MAG: hypothetical protein OSJ45_10450 [Lachnospiraceae bacterium]|nr:hypothetical protein [Lachnospiraceae bacterium]
MALAMNMGDFSYYMNLPVFELLDLCDDYKELCREIKEAAEDK